MSVLEINDNLNIRTMSKYFKNVIKSADYNDDMTIKFNCEGDAHVDLAGLQILYAVKKELAKNGKNLIVEGMNNLFDDYLKIINDKNN
ncbi:anti-anti-sigma factor [uncultured Brachyspira sp.]|uniref:anti-anti-sigma factor n=1 Tax=uncultured Brachyspira sp. TaxID=221953 RepID=UPI0025E0728C|nr:anti-anti-sigma factor [uncultured Brachyspira sp.]